MASALIDLVARKCYTNYKDTQSLSLDEEEEGHEHKFWFGS